MILHPSGLPSAHLSAPSPVATDCGGLAGLAVTQLEAQAAVYLKNSVAASTWKTYGTAQTLFLQFCLYLGYTLLSVSEDTLVLQSTAIRSNAGLGPQRHQAHQAQAKPRFPITPAVLSWLRLSLLRVPGHDDIVLWAACYLALPQVQQSLPSHRHQHMIPPGTCLSPM